MIKLFVILLGLRLWLELTLHLYIYTLKAIIKFPHFLLKKWVQLWMFCVFLIKTSFLYMLKSSIPLTIWGDVVCLFVFLKELKPYSLSKPQFCQMSIAVSGRDSRSLEPVPRSASHLMNSLVYFILSLSLLAFLLSFACFVLPVKFLQSGVSTMCSHSICCNWAQPFLGL